MVTAKSPCFGSDAGRRTKRLGYRLGIFAALVGLAACNPIETWRDWTGVSQNDPDPETTPNTRNLAAGEASDYPNLATVPPPPVRAMTAAERDKLTQSLIADRANARYSNEQLRAGFSSSAAAPPPPSSSPAAAEPEVATAASEPSPPLPAAAPLTAPSASAASAALPASPPVSNSTGTGGAKSVAPSSSAATRSAQAGRKQPAAPGTGPRKQGEPPEPGPMESSLEVPQARATPVPEQIEAAPPPPQLPPPPQVASSAKTVSGGLAAGGALAPRSLPEAKTTAGFEPAPAAPELPPPAPTRSAATEAGGQARKAPAPVAKTVAEIRFASDSTGLTEADRQKLETVVPLYQQNPGKVRVVGYTQPGNGAVEQLNGYRAALDRARAVADALKQAGIPAEQIQVEAAPAGGNSGESRAEVLLEH